MAVACAQKRGRMCDSVWLVVRFAAAAHETRSAWRRRCSASSILFCDWRMLARLSSVCIVVGWKGPTRLSVWPSAARAAASSGFSASLTSLALVCIERDDDVARLVALALSMPDNASVSEIPVNCMLENLA